MWHPGIIAAVGILMLAIGSGDRSGIPGRPADPDQQRAARKAGEGLFYDLACWKCHAMGDEEPPGNPDVDNAGPDLSSVGTRLSPEAILRSILDPSAEIAEPVADHTYPDGTSRMPPFAGVIPKDDLKNLVIFLSTRKAPAAEKDPIVSLTEKNFRATIGQTRGLVLLDFWAEWCVPCLELEPVLEGISAEFKGRVHIFKLNVDDNPALVAEYVPDNIFPCLVLMRGGKVVDRRYGTDPKMKPREFLRGWLTAKLKE